MLLQAVALARLHGLPVTLRAVGAFETPAYEASIKRLAGQLGLEDAIHWTGFCQDVPAELAQMDLFALPSLFGEGLPMVVLEAMASGVPVIATKVEGVPEAIRDGREGLLVAPGNSQELAAAIARVAEGLVDWSQLREAAHRRQVEKFSDQSMARGVARVYRRVLS